jgi:WhiB family redox-sensing transcriptional regulator
VPDWSSDAACLTVDPETFFPHGEGQTAWPRIAKAKAICEACPVVEVCLEFALSTKAQYGIWGGTTPLERRRIRRMEERHSVARTLVVVQPLWQRDVLEHEELPDLLSHH